MRRAVRCARRMAAGSTPAPGSSRARATRSSCRRRRDRRGRLAPVPTSVRHAAAGDSPTHSLARGLARSVGPFVRGYEHAGGHARRRRATTVIREQQLAAGANRRDHLRRRHRDRRLGAGPCEPGASRASAWPQGARPAASRRATDRHLQPHELCRRPPRARLPPARPVSEVPRDRRCVQGTGDRSDSAQARLHRRPARQRHRLDLARRAVEALAHGEAIGLFPEGRLTRRPERWPERAKTGAVRLAQRSGVPIVPVASSNRTEAGTQTTPV